MLVSTRDGPYLLYTAKADGSGKHALTKDRGTASSERGLHYQIDPAWSRDGTRIAFASSRDGPTHLFVVRLAGKLTTMRLTSGKSEDTHPSWSPDGRRIAFTRSGPSRVMVMNADGSGAHRLTGDLAEEDDPAWSPDGRWIAYDRRVPGSTVKEIWIARPDGSVVHQVTKLGATSWWPTWSPDSKRIAFTSDKRGGTYAIYSIGVDGKGLAVESSTSSDEFEPAWSPDGKSIAFSRDGAIVVVPVGSGTENVITSPNDNDSDPVWNPSPEKPKKSGPGY